MKNKFKNITIIGLSLFGVSMLIYWKYLFLGYEFAWYNDQAFQYNLFYKEYYSIIRESLNNHTLSIYSWDLFLGTDFFTSKLFTVVGDFILVPIFLLFDNITDFNILFCLETIICLILSGINIYLFLDKFGIEKDYIKNAYSLIYALSGFVVVYSGTYMFHRFYALLPLLFFFVERYIQDKKTIGFVIIIALLFVQNYELMFSTSLFLVLYFILSYKLKYEIKIIGILKESIKLIVCFFVSLMICGIFIIPLVLYIKSSTRVGGGNSEGLFWNLKILTGFFNNYFTSPFNLRTAYPDYIFYNDTHFGNEYSFYSTSITLIGILNLLVVGDKKDKKVIAISYLLLTVFLLFKPLNSIVHGFSEPTMRWTFLLLFFNIWISSYSFDKYKIEKSWFIIVVPVLFACLFVFYLISIDFNKTQFLSIIPTLVGLLLYVVNYNLLLNDRFKFVLIIVVIELLSMNILVQKEMFNYQHISDSVDKKNIDYILSENSDNLSRIYINPEKIGYYSDLSLNNGLLYGYMGTSSYDSAYEYSLNDFLLLNGIDHWIINLNNSDVFKMLGVKYYCVENDFELPKNNNFKYVGNINNFEVYKDINSNNIGHTYSSFIKKSNVTNLLDWNNTLIVEDEDYEKVKDIDLSDKVQLNITDYNRQYFSADINCKNKQVLMISIPYSSGWHIYDQDRNAIETFKVQGGFLGMVVNNSISRIDCYYQTPGLKTGIVLSGLGVLCFVFEVYLNNRRFKKKKMVTAN